jgi:hypothetical protein
MTAEMNHFEGILDQYNGITVDSTAELCSIETFSQKLEGKMIQPSEDFIAY